MKEEDGRIREGGGSEEGEVPPGSGSGCVWANPRRCRDAALCSVSARELTGEEKPAVAVETDIDAEEGALPDSAEDEFNRGVTDLDATPLDATPLDATHTHTQTHTDTHTEIHTQTDTHTETQNRKSTRLNSSH